MITSWRRWIQQDTPKAVQLAAPTHRRLKALAEETSMPMRFWSDMAVRFFLSHLKADRLIDAAKGITIEQWEARENIVHNMVDELIEETGGKRPSGQALLEGPKVTAKKAANGAPQTPG